MTSECHLGAVLVDNRLQGATRNCLQLKQTKGGISVGVTIYFFFHVKKKKKNLQLLEPPIENKKPGGYLFTSGAGRQTCSFCFVFLYSKLS